MLAEKFASAKPTLSFEFFPPKEATGDAQLWTSFNALLDASPDFVSVTYGAGGSNQDRTLELLGRMAAQIPTIGHLTCVGATAVKVKENVKRFAEAGVTAILALRGDPPLDHPDTLAHGELKTALELVELIRSVSELEIGVAAFPEKHPESPDLQHDSMVLGMKQQAGASFAMTQLFFSMDAYRDFLEKNRDQGVTIPIIPGVMPIANAKQVLRMAELSGATVPENLRLSLQAAQGDAELTRKIGLEFTIQLAAELVGSGAPGIHIFSLNQHDAALEVARGAGLLS